MIELLVAENMWQDVVAVLRMENDEARLGLEKDPYSFHQRMFPEVLTNQEEEELKQEKTEKYVKYFHPFLFELLTRRTMKLI